jgi:hypothetical protein
VSTPDKDPAKLEADLAAARAEVARLRGMAGHCGSCKCGRSVLEHDRAALDLAVMERERHADEMAAIQQHQARLRKERT